VCNYLGAVTRVLGLFIIWLSIVFNVIDLVIFLEWEIFRGYLFSFIFLILVD